jgi:hypothetical protein
VSNPSPLAPANGDFDLVPDAAVLHELGAPHGSISPCAARIAQAGKRVGGRRLLGIAAAPQSPVGRPARVPLQQLPTVFVSRTLGALTAVTAVFFEGGVMIIVKEIGLSLLIAVGAVAASNVLAFALEWFSVLFQ